MLSGGDVHVRRRIAPVSEIRAQELA